MGLLSMSFLLVFCTLNFFSNISTHTTHENKKKDKNIIYKKGELNLGKKIVFLSFL